MILLMQDMIKQSPESYKQEVDGFQIVGAQLPTDRVLRHVETIYASMRVDLGKHPILRLFLARSRSVTRLPSGWTNSELVSKFPTLVLLNLNGRECAVALGQPTASVSHGAAVL